MPANISQFLKAQEKKWGDAVTEAKTGGSFKEYPDGTYLFQLTGAAVGFSQNDRPQVTWSQAFVDGDFDGDIYRSFDGLDGEKSLMFLAMKLGRFGVDPDGVKLSRLEDTLDDLADRAPFFKGKLITKKTDNGEYQNLRVVKVYPDGYDPSGMTDDDDTPTPTRKKDEEPEPAPAPTRRGRTAAKDQGTEPAAAPQRGRGRKAAAAPEPEPEPEPDPELESKGDEDEVDLEVGMKVNFTRKGQELLGTVTEILEDEELLKVKVGIKTYTVEMTDETLSLAETDD